MSAITFGELEAGFANSRAPDAARQQAAPVFQAVAVAPFDEAAARTFGQVQSAAPAKRGAYDRQIAAHAISLGLPVVTNNERDFEDIPGLRVENWIALLGSDPGKPQERHLSGGSLRLALTPNIRVKGDGSLQRLLRSA